MQFFFALKPRWLVVNSYSLWSFCVFDPDGEEWIKAGGDGATPVEGRRLKKAQISNPTVDGWNQSHSQPPGMVLKPYK